MGWLVWSNRYLVLGRSVRLIAGLVRRTSRTVQEGCEGHQVVVNRALASAQTSHQLLQPRRAQVEGVNVADNMPKAAIFVQALARGARKDSRSNTRDLRRHLQQQRLMPG